MTFNEPHTISRAVFDTSSIFSIKADAFRLKTLIIFLTLGSYLVPLPNVSNVLSGALRNCLSNHISLSFGVISLFLGVTSYCLENGNKFFVVLLL